ncbi:MAG: tetratricopeptide repeat protein [Magnetovibrio sp.]|nr:tetratricopeptide repeat protein [Magnetovibrio sp.]
MTHPAHAAGLKAYAEDRFEDAAALFAEACAASPNDVTCHYDHGRALFLLWRFAAAEAALRRALGIDPEHLQARAYLGRAVDGQGRLDEAVDCFREVLAGQPDQAAVHLLLAQTLLHRGDFAEGWEEYEWRYGGEAGRPYPDFGVPQWNGEALAGKTIFVLGEQGYGDTIQFVRYVPMLKDLGAAVVFGCSQPLMRLLQPTPGIDRAVNNWPRPGSFDYFCPLSSLPRAFRTTTEAIPVETPYLAPKASLRRRWARRLDDVTGPHVGLCWQGRPSHPNDRYRSIGLRPMIDALPAAAGYVSLQVGTDAEGAVVRVFDDKIGDFADTAALIAGLDLVITVDTSIAHLAGALGAEAWVLLPSVPDWRWRRTGETCAWYPSLKLFRQSAPGDWAPVLTEVSAALRDRFGLD